MQVTMRRERASELVTPSAGVVLRNRTARSTNTLQGWLAVLLGVPFVGCGVAVALLIAGKVGIENGGRLNMPPPVVGAMGATFALVGLSLIVYGVSATVRRARMPARRARYAGQPWMWDYAWDRRGGRDETRGEIARALWVASFVELFLVPFHWVAFLSPDRPVIFQVVTVLFDAAMLGVVGRAAYLAARGLRYGPSRLRFASFPYARGAEAVLDLTGVSPRARRHPITATLRCVQERYETRRSGGDTERTTVCYELSRDVRTVAPGEPTVRFPIPADAPPTTLGERPPCYWELELEADVPGIDFGARFLVPVY